jgi:hypothetical protein
MDSTEVEQLCERLRKLVERGPWKDPEGLREAMATVQALRTAAAAHLRGVLAAIEENFERLFETRRWHSDLESQRLSDSLTQDIREVETHWNRPGAPE